MATSNLNTLVVSRNAEETPAGPLAELVVNGLAVNAVTAVRFSKRSFHDVDLTECLAKLNAAVERVHSGDLRDTEALLTAQAMTLNTIFGHLADRAAKAEHIDHLDRYLRLALKAQGQCRATLDTFRPQAALSAIGHLTKGSL